MVFTTHFILAEVEVSVNLSINGMSFHRQQHIRGHARFERTVCIRQAKLDLENHVAAVVGVEDVVGAELGFGGDVKNGGCQRLAGQQRRLHRQALAHLDAVQVSLGHVDAQFHLVQRGDGEQWLAG